MSISSGRPRCELYCRRQGRSAVFGPWLEYFTKNGQPYASGERFRNPDYAATLESLAASDCESYYRGEIMQKIVDFSNRTGGFFAESDFANYKAQWVGAHLRELQGLRRLRNAPQRPRHHRPDGSEHAQGAGSGRLPGVRRRLSQDDRGHQAGFRGHQEVRGRSPLHAHQGFRQLSERYAAVRRALITDQAVYPRGR